MVKTGCPARPRAMNATTRTAESLAAFINVQDTADYRFRERSYEKRRPSGPALYRSKFYCEGKVSP
ncbi:hypothetical protein [Nisaea sp.]|uniref:hypothetical protein n=1 Tax=Nisaea sp. TaxID=2024842 RepID=UPI0032990E0C